MLREYAVSRNLLVRFAADDIDQSSALAGLLKARFTDSETGIGGRLEFKKLDGNHVTPNTPVSLALLDTLDWGLLEQMGLADGAGGLVDAAAEAARASEVVGEFARREARRAATQ